MTTYCDKLSWDMWQGAEKNGKHSMFKAHMTADGMRMYFLNQMDGRFYQVDVKPLPLLKDKELVK